MNGFLKNNEFYLGVNYWSSRDSINMWSNWDADVIENDFKMLFEYGIKVIRMFILWPVFQPLKALWSNSKLYEYRMMPGETPLPDTEAGQAGVSEEACGHFEEFCHIADKYGIKLIVGLLTGHMSFRFYAPEAFDGKNFLSDPRLIKWEVRFVRYFVKRFKNENAILAWDLGNECNNYGGVDQDQSYVWTHAIKSAIYESDAEHPVVSGFDCGMSMDDGPFKIKEMGELLDVLTTHPYHIFANPMNEEMINTIRPCVNPTVYSSIFENLSGKSCFIEEVGSIGYANCSEKTEALFALSDLFSSWAHNCNGYFWWCAFDQGHLEYAPYDWNNIGSDYGIFRADGSAKPIADTFKKFKMFLDEFPYANIPKHMSEAVCIMTREMDYNTVSAASSFIMAKQAGYDISFAHAEDKLPDADLYLMPSVTAYHPIFLRRLNELLEKVREGATLYLSTDQLFRRIPELTGLTVSGRERDGSVKVKLNETEFEFHDALKYRVESVADTCEVLAETADGEPFFVCNKYGKGKIYYMPYKLEYSVGKAIYPFGSGKPEYFKFYEYLLKDSKRAARSLNPMTLITEHIIDSDKRIIVAINHDVNETELNLKLKDGWQTGKVYYGNKIIPSNDACVFEVIKKS